MFRPLCVLMLTSTIAIAQRPCADDQRTPDLGYGLLTCHDCLSSMMMSDGVRILRFTGQPAVFKIRANGPAAGKLFEGDTLVSVNRLAVTSDSAAIALARWRPGAIALGVRHDGSISTVTIMPTPVCLSNPDVTRQPDDSFRNDVARIRLQLQNLQSRLQVSRSLALADSARVLARNNLQTTAASMRDLARVIRLRADSMALSLAKDSIGLGVTLSCSSCTIRSSSGHRSWTFSEFPVVASVEAGSFADRIGLRRGDTLTAIDGQSVLTPAGSDKMTAPAPGTTLTVTWQRAGKTQSATATTGSKGGGAPSPLRATERVGNSSVEVRGEATWSRDAGTGAISVSGDSITVVVTPLTARQDTLHKPLPRRPPY